MFDVINENGQENMKMLPEFTDGVNIIIAHFMLIAAMLLLQHHNDVTKAGMVVTALIALSTIVFIIKEVISRNKQENAQG